MLCNTQDFVPEALMLIAKLYCPGYAPVPVTYQYNQLGRGLRGVPLHLLDLLGYCTFRFVPAPFYGHVPTVAGLRQTLLPHAISRH